MRKRVALAQMLILDPKILLMDEPFSALDVQTRQLMENELLELWSADRKSVLFITHDLEEAIALSDRVIVLSAGPETHPIGEFVIDLPRPRDVNEIRMTPRFVEIHGNIWHAMKDEVLKGYAQSRKSSERASPPMTINMPRARLVLYHALLLGGVFLFWYAMTEPGLIPPFWFDDPTRAKFFFGQPLKVFQAHLDVVLQRQHLPASLASP